MRLEIEENVVAQIRSHAREGYPEESCGILLGVVGEGSHGEEPRRVSRLLTISNERERERERRYLIGPDAFRRAEAEAIESGLDVVGVYHSHPDHPAIPSEVDRELAWPWYSYLIVSVIRGRPQTLRSWRLQPDRSGFQEEALQVEGGAQARSKP